MKDNYQLFKNGRLAMDTARVFNHNPLNPGEIM